LGKGIAAGTHTGQNNRSEDNAVGFEAKHISHDEPPSVSFRNDGSRVAESNTAWDRLTLQNNRLTFPQISQNLASM
jgi:hypothetical protein